MQRIKGMYLESDTGEMADKKAVLGALALYLDFINLFMILLPLFGQRRGGLRTDASTSRGCASDTFFRSLPLWRPEKSSSLRSAANARSSVSRSSRAKRRDRTDDVASYTGPKRLGAAYLIVSRGSGYNHSPVAGRDQAFGKKYFLMLSPSVLNSTRVPRS